MRAPKILPLPSGLEPQDAYRCLRGRPKAVLLESTDRDPGAAGGRYSFLVVDPFIHLSSYGSRVTIREGETTRKVSAPPLEVVRAELSRHAVERVAEGGPFQGGAVGYFGYEFGQTLEDIPTAERDCYQMPEMDVGIYDCVLCWDHVAGESWIVSTGLPAPEAEREARAEVRARELLTLLAGVVQHRPWTETAGPSDDPRETLETWPVAGLPGIRSTFSREAYLEVVDRVRRYVWEGDIFQANISQRFQGAWEGDPFDLYVRLGQHNPAAFAAYLEVGDAAIVSASPERFLRVMEGTVESRPIKGTAPRGKGAVQDEEFERSLLSSLKDRAENVMIVDLVRNDLSRVCEDYSVRVTQLCAVEKHPTVLHLVSTIEGRLRPDVDALDLLAASFPGGSITGAPKIRAMEIISELEPTRRGAYTGSIGYIGFLGDMDLSIVIRTFIVRGGTAYAQVGGGIVADSDPLLEYQETLEKARGLVAALMRGHGSTTG